MSKQSNPGTTPDVSHVANPDIAHERSDVNVRAIMWFILGLLISGIAIHLVIGGLYKYLDARETKLEAPPVSLVAPQGERLPPEPRLQTKPQQDLKQLRAEEDAKLDSYGWVDQQAGIARIPIEQAMKLVAKKGLPVSQTGQKDEQCDCQLEAPKAEKK